MKFWRILLILVVVVCIGVAVSYPIRYKVELDKTNEEMEELSGMRRRVLDAMEAESRADAAPETTDASEAAPEAEPSEPSEAEPEAAPGSEPYESSEAEPEAAPGSEPYESSEAEPVQAAEVPVQSTPEQADASLAAEPEQQAAVESEPAQQDNMEETLPEPVEKAETAPAAEAAEPQPDGTEVPTAAEQAPADQPSKAPVQDAEEASSAEPAELVEVEAEGELEAQELPGTESTSGETADAAMAAAPDGEAQAPTSTAEPTPTPTPSPTPSPTPTPGIMDLIINDPDIATPTPVPTATPKPTPSPTPSPTPDRKLRDDPDTYRDKEKIVLDEDQILPELRDIYNLNHDLIGWLYIAGTNIDYPVVQHRDREYYLRRDFYGNENANGQIILDAGCDPYTPSYNLVISGHHMNSGAMFGLLQQYKEFDFWKTHKIIEFDSLMERKEYVVFAAFYSADYDENEEGFRYSVNIQFKIDAESWLKEIRDYKIYDTAIDVAYGDEFITLTTCDHSRRNDGRFVVVARRIREGEKIV